MPNPKETASWSIGVLETCDADWPHPSPRSAVAYPERTVPAQWRHGNGTRSERLRIGADQGIMTCPTAVNGRSARVTKREFRAYGGTTSGRR